LVVFRIAYPTAVWILNFKEYEGVEYTQMWPLFFIPQMR
jgi:hypothetical protein